MTTPTTVVLATDSFLIGDGLGALLADVEGITVVGRVDTHADLAEMVESTAPDVVVLSIRNPLYATRETIRMARELRADNPALGIVVIGESADGFALELLREGSSRLAFLLDDSLPDLPTLLRAVAEVREGRTALDPRVVDELVERIVPAGVRLSERETDVLAQLAEGLSNRAIAAEVHLSTKAVEKYIGAIFRKLDLTDPTLVDRRVSAALAYLRGQTSPLLGLLRGIGEEQRMQQALALGRATLAAVVESTSTGLMTCDPSGDRLTMDTAALALHGLGSESEIRASVRDYSDDWVVSLPDGRVLDVEEWPLVRAERGDFVRELEVHVRIVATGREWDGSINVVPVRDATGRVVQVVATVRDITAPRAAERELLRQQGLLEQQARTDELTGIANRRQFVAMAQHEMSRARRSGSPLSVALLDIDRFKDYNDRYGHATGDLALQRVARLVPEVLREVDLFARIGGDEFALLLPGSDAAGTADVVARVRAVLESHPLRTDGESTAISLSVGAVTFLHAGESLEALLVRADAALYDDKRARAGLAS